MCEVGAETVGGACVSRTLQVQSIGVDVARCLLCFPYTFASHCSQRGVLPLDNFFVFFVFIFVIRQSTSRVEQPV